MLSRVTKVCCHGYLLPEVNAYFLKIKFRNIINFPKVIIGSHKNEFFARHINVVCLWGYKKNLIDL